MGQLIKDKNEPDLYRQILVDKVAERQLLVSAKGSKKPVQALVNGILELVFTKKELGSSSGLGMRTHKESPNSGQKIGPPLDPLRVSAVKGKYITFFLHFLILSYLA
jgi:hypothetical protein